MLLPSGHYSGDLKEVSTVTLPFQSKPSRDALWLNRGQHHLSWTTETNPERWQRPTLSCFISSMSNCLQIRPSPKNDQGYRFVPFLGCRRLSLLIDFFVAAATDLKKSPWAASLDWKVPGTRRRWADPDAISVSLEPNLPICIPTRCHRTSCNQNLQNHNHSAATWTIGFSEVLCSGDLNSRSLFCSNSGGVPLLY